MPLMEFIFRAFHRRAAHTIGLGLSLVLGGPALWAQPSQPPPPPPRQAPPPLPPEVLAQRPTEPPPGMPDPTELREQLALLYEFLSAPPEKLEKMRRTIELIESMSPENREFLRMRLVKLQEDAPALEAEIAEYAAKLEKEDQTLARRYWLSLRADEREAEREKLDQMQKDERTGYLAAQVESFREKQAELRERLQKPEGGPPNFIPPPPPFIPSP